MPDNVLDATIHHPKKFGYTDGRDYAFGWIDAFEPQRDTFDLSGVEFFEPRNAFILQPLYLFEDMTFAKWEVEEGALYEMEPFTDQYPPLQRFAYLNSDGGAFSVKSRFFLPPEPFLALFIERADPADDDTFPIVELHLSVRKVSIPQWKLIIPLNEHADADETVRLYKSTDNGRIWQEVANLRRDGNFETDYDRVARALGAQQEIIEIAVIGGEIFISTSRGGTFRYAEGGHNFDFPLVPQGAVRIKGAGQAMSVLMLRGVYQPNGNAVISQSSKRTAPPPLNSVVSSQTYYDADVPDDGSSSITFEFTTDFRTKAKLSAPAEPLTGYAAKTPVLRRWDALHEQEFGPVDSSNIAASDLGKVTSATWVEDGGLGGYATVTIENVSMLASLPKRNSIIEIKAGSDGTFTRVWWGITGKPKIVITKKPYLTVEIPCETIRGRLRRKRCARIAGNKRGWNYHALFNFAMNCFGMPDSLLEFTDDGFIIDSDFEVNAAWDGVQFLREFVKIRGDREVVVDYDNMTVVEQQIALTGVSAYTLTDTGGDVIEEYDTDDDDENFANFIMAQYEEEFRGEKQPQLAYFIDADSIATESDADFTGHSYEAYEDLFGTEEIHHELYALARNLNRIPRVAVWKRAQGEVFHVGEFVTVGAISGSDVPQGTLLKVIRAQHAFNADRREWKSEFTIAYPMDAAQEEV